MKTIAQLSEETIKLMSYVETLPDGYSASYQEIESRSGVRMDQKGKASLRTVFKNLKREYSTMKGKGIEIACAKTATSIVVSKLVKIDKAVKRGEKSFNNISSRFYLELEPQEQKQINFIGAAFGAIRLAAENGKHYLKEEVKATLSHPTLPENI